ncbi:MAG: serine/threonine protein kinase [Bacteroidales bacterium]|nr:serine/threonine protein kinase [Bacteroidales bacterium]
MAEDSGFLSSPYAGAMVSGALECIHCSVSGWSVLYRVNRDGRFRVLKALKQEYRGRVLYESLLKKEYEIGYSLSHPGVCEVYGFVDDPSLGHAIEMEWIDGCPLDELLSRGSLKPGAALRLADQLCDAVSYLHSRQIVHRDIKPSNILVTHNGVNVKLIDFGLSDSDSWASLKGAAGTRPFFAPEVVISGVADVRSDIWSIGKVLSMLMPGKTRAVRKCMAADPDRRYQSAEDLKKALHRRAWPVLLVAGLAVALTVAAVLLMPRKAAPAPIEDAVPERDSVPAMVTDTAVIDELFRQATDIISSH